MPPAIDGQRTRLRPQDWQFLHGDRREFRGEMLDQRRRIFVLDCQPSPSGEVGAAGDLPNLGHQSAEFVAGNSERVLRLPEPHDAGSDFARHAAFMLQLHQRNVGRQLATFPHGRQLPDAPSRDLFEFLLCSRTTARAASRRVFARCAATSSESSRTCAAFVRLPTASVAANASSVSSRTSEFVITVS